MKKPRLIIVFSVLALCILAVVATARYVQVTRTSTQSKAALGEIINTQAIATESAVVKKGSVTRFSLYSEEGYLYKTQNKGLSSATELMVENPPVATQVVDSNVLGDSTTDPNTGYETFLPDEVVQNTELRKSNKDVDDKFLKKRGFTLSKEHYTFEQVVNDLPVYGGQLAVHIKNTNEIYALDGSLIENPVVPSQKVSLEDARRVALEEAKKQEPTIPEFIIQGEKKYVFNKAIIGSGEDKNTLTLRVTVGTKEFGAPFLMQYFVDLENGSIVFRQSLIEHAKERKIVDFNNCRPSETGEGIACEVIRTESDPPINDSDADRVFDLLGIIYDYYNSNFGRDSYDNRGSPLFALVHGTEATMPGLGCPNNAAWLMSPVDAMVFCNGFIAPDVTGHEVTHGVINHSANLMYNSQSGALNESIADIFGQTMDNNWTIGEDSPLGVFRDMSDPPQTPRTPQPDRLFSSLYQCTNANDQCSIVNDNCGVHYNSGVLNKAFYLMTEGGEFNGCNVQGIGTEKSHAIIYRALTTYLLETSNFKSMFDAINRACNDLYGEGSSDCVNVMNALKSTEMDQQPDFEQSGARCLGQTAQAVQCQSTGPTPTPNPNATPTPTPVRNTPTPTPPATDLTVTPTGSGGKSLIFSIHLQGIGINENRSPKNKERKFSVIVSDSNNEEVVQKEGIMAYQSLKGEYIGTIELSGLRAGDYLVKISVPGYLSKRVPSIVTISQASSYTLPIIELIPGDVNGDNIADILDYNQIASCYGTRSSGGNCNSQSDLNDDGRTDGVDLNLLLRGLAVRLGD